MLGGWIGLIISLTLNNIAFYYIPSNPANLTLWIVMPILCVLFGILSLFIRKTFIIFATCKILVIFSFDWSLYVLEGFELVFRGFSQWVFIGSKVPFRIGGTYILAILFICDRISYFNCLFICTSVLAFYQKIRNYEPTQEYWWRIRWNIGRYEGKASRFWINCKF